VSVIYNGRLHHSTTTTTTLDDTHLACLANVLILHALAGRRQVIFGVRRRSHLFREESPETSTIGLLNRNLLLAPIRHVMFRVPGHPTCHSRHQPGIPVSDLIGRVTTTPAAANLIVRRKAIVGLDGMLDIVTSGQGLDTQNVIQMKTFVTRNSGCDTKRRCGW